MTLPATEPVAAPTYERTFVRCERGVVEVACRRVGGRTAAPRLVGLHGLGSDSRDLVAVAEQVGVPALLVDLPGFGRSPREDGPYPTAEAAGIVVALLDALRVGAPVWLGCSYGGHVALRAALDRPERVGGLVLVDSGGLDPNPPRELASLFSEERLAGRSLGEVRASLELLVARPTSLTRRWRSRRLARHFAAPGPGGGDYPAVSRAAAGALADDAGRRLEQVRAPVELVHGANDPLVPLELARRAARRLPRATLTVLPDLGHVPWLEAPGAVAARARRALRRVHDTESTGGTR